MKSSTIPSSSGRAPAGRVVLMSAATMAQRAELHLDVSDSTLRQLAQRFRGEAR